MSYETAQMSFNLLSSVALLDKLEYMKILNYECMWAVWSMHMSDAQGMHQVCRTGFFATCELIKTYCLEVSTCSS